MCKVLHIVCSFLVACCAGRSAHRLGWRSGACSPRPVAKPQPQERRSGDPLQENDSGPGVAAQYAQNGPVPAGELWPSMPMKTGRPKKKDNPQSKSPLSGPPRLLNAELAD